jgi:cytochrome c oxidase subunit 2
VNRLDSKKRTGSRRPRHLRLVFLVAPLVLLLAACSGSGPQSALEPQGPVARTINHLWLLVFSIAAGVFILVEAALIYALIRYRARKGDDREPVQVHGNPKLEIILTIIPALILASIGYPVVKGIFDVRAIASGPDVLQVHVIGHQWWWEFQYVDYVGQDGRALTTANELYIPEDTEVNLTMTSADVIHSFWVPTLAGKRDLVPGRISNITLAADDPTPPDQPHPGQCAEFCGLAHADMRFKVHVRTQADFDAWIAAQLEPATIPTQGAAAAGYETFSNTCVACHGATVAGPDGVTRLGPERQIEIGDVTFAAAYAPDLTHFGSRFTFAGSTFDNTEEHVAQWIENPSALKPMHPELNDVANGRILGMPDLGLSSDQIDSLVTLLEGWK